MRTTTKRLTKAEMRAFLEDYAMAWNDHDLDAVVSRLTEDVVWDHPFTIEPLRGRAAARADLAETYRSFPDLHFPVEDSRIYPGDDHASAVATWTMVGTMAGPARGAEPTGRTVRISGVVTYRFRDGLIAEQTIVYDGLEFSRQLGLLPSEKSLTFKALLELQRLGTKARKALRL